MPTDARPPVHDTLSFLLGQWRVSRTIEDHLGDVDGSFRGTATWTEVPGTGTEWGGPGRGVVARYEEAGDLTLGERILPAQRNLEYRGVGEGAVMVYFSDGRPFADLDLRGGAWASTHLCGADTYETATAVLGADLVEERWRVRGPAKDYDAVTILRRVS